MTLVNHLSILMLKNLNWWFFHKGHIQSFLQDSRSDWLAFSIDERFWHLELRKRRRMILMTTKTDMSFQFYQRSIFCSKWSLLFQLWSRQWKDIGERHNSSDNNHCWNAHHRFWVEFQKWSGTVRCFSAVVMVNFSHKLR